MKHLTLILVLVILAFSGFAQYEGFDIFGSQSSPYSDAHMVVTLDTLQEAKTLEDINKWFKASWVEDYIFVEVSSNCGDVVKKAVGKNDTLTIEQKELIKMANADCTVYVKVDYIPINNLSDNLPKKMNFSLKVNPIYEANYVDGNEKLKAFLKEKTVDKISKTTLEQIKIATAKFNINEAGEVVDAYIFKSSEDDSIDQLMLDGINSMPQWNPAKNLEGKNIAQEFEFSLGTQILYGCYKN